MKIYKTFLVIGGEGAVVKMDTIENEGRYWLVPTWIDAKGGTVSTPERVIPLDQFEHQTSGGDIADFVVNSPIPKKVFHCVDPATEAPEYEIYLSPGLQSPDDKPSH